MPSGGERAEHVPGRADGVAHVVQAVEHRHQVVAVAGVSGGGRGLEAHAIPDAGLLGPSPRGLDRAGVVVGADERRARERAGHQDRRRAVAAADVGDAGAALEPLDDAVERGQPGRDQVGVVAGPEEALAAVVDVVVVLVPADAGAAARGIGDARRVQHAAERDLEEPGQVGRAVGVGERDGLLGRQAVAALGRVVLDVAAGGLRVEPLAHVALGRAGARGELAGRERPGAGERAVEAEAVAHHDQRRVERGADLVDGAEHELLELGGVQRRLFDDVGGHRPKLRRPGPAGYGARSLLFCERRRQLVARADPELAVGGAEVLLDGLAAHVQRLGDVAVRASRRPPAPRPVARWS